MKYLTGNVIGKTLLLFIIATPLSSYAQHTILDSYLQEGVQNNKQLQHEKFSVQSAIESLNQAKGLFFPDVSANSTYQIANGGRKINFPIGDLLNPAYDALNQITGTNNFPHLDNINESMMTNKYQDTYLSASLSILNTDVYYNYKAHQKMVDVRKAQVEVFTNILKQRITNAYFEYLSAIEANKILEANKNTVLELKLFNEKQYNAGTKTKDAISDAEYEVSLVTSNIVDAEKNIKLTRAYFNYLINRDLDEDIIVDEQYSDTNVIVFEDILPSNDLFLLRKELTQLSSMIDVNRNLLNLNKKNAWIPKIYITGNLGFQGYDYKFNNDQFYQFLQVGIKWTLFNGGINKSKIKEAKIAVRISENQYDDIKQQLQLEVKQAYEEYNSSLQSYKTARQGLDSANESYNIIYKKYTQNQALWLDLIDKQNKLKTAQIRLSIAKYNVLIKQTNYKKSIANL